MDIGRKAQHLAFALFTENKKKEQDSDHVVLIQSSTSYLCEMGFSAFVNIKSKKRERLKTAEHEMERVCPDIQDICRR
jgi:hypothetical protein